MLERAKEVTRRGPYTYLEYARFADDLVVRVDAYAQHDWLLKVVEKRRREELAASTARCMRPKAGSSIWQRARASDVWALSFGVCAVAPANGGRSTRPS